MASALPASSQIALRASVSVFCAGKWDVDAADVLAHVRSRFPIMGAVIVRTDISSALRSIRFCRDHAAGATAWKHCDRDHPRFGKAATDALALQKEGAN